jgi:hypothetical protein
MRLVLIAAMVVIQLAPAHAYTWRDSPSTRFDNDIRANNESMRQRFSDPRNHVETQNNRMRERLNSSGGSRSVPPLRDR